MLIWEPQTAPAQAASTYYALSTHTRLWYVGKADAIRTNNALPWSGLALRAREHIVASARGTGPQSHRPRYRTWGNVQPHTLMFIPGVFCSQGRCLRF